MRVSRQRVVAAPPENVWGLIASVERLPEWFAGVEAAASLPGPVEGIGRRQRLTRYLRGHTVEMEQEVVAWDPPRLLALRHVRESIEGRDVTGVRNFVTRLTLAPVGGGTRVTIQYEWGARFGIAWLQSMLLGGRVMGRELLQTLRRVEAIASAG